MNSRSLASVGRVPARDRRPDQLGREPADGAQHGPGPAQADQEREHAPRIGQRAVEVEGGDGRAVPAAAAHRPRRGQSSAVPPRPAPPANRDRALERLAAGDDLAPAPGLSDGGVLLGQAPLLQGAHPVRAQADLGERGQLVGQPDGRRQGLARRARPGWPGPWPAPRAPCDGPAREDEVHGAPVAHDAGEPHRAEVAQGDAEAPAEHAEDGVLGGHPQVAPQRQLQSPGHGVALDGGDDRLGQGQAGRAHRARALVGDRPAVALGHRLEVGAGAERPLGAGEHGHRAVARRGRRPGTPRGAGRRRRCRRRCAARAGRW